MFLDNTNLKELSERNKQRIMEEKKERDQLGGKHHPKEQYHGINGYIHLKRLHTLRAML